MDRFYIEKVYLLNGLSNCKLRSTEDLLKVHGIDFNSIEGYNRLDDINRAIYEKFIINFFNSLGLESRSTLILKEIYYVEHTNLLVKDIEDDSFIVVGENIKAIDRNGIKYIIHSWTDDYNDLEPIEGESKNYLRFEYEHNDRKEWY